ncbi:hypothetical protein EVG20_g4945 [Dentipellis fragilis]|uniref:Sfi1 spindle body domain-containing protein n=1 Tax=Dentipellis fragilis TaxID=205917 RepID=A0A4Y9YWL2_9AGAM|nr:hypothetical protein EVG20_g4945 [Dentipellis fragilis]
MSLPHFRPLRSSPPPKSSSYTNTLVAPTTAVSDISRSSAVSNPELASLTPDQVDFIDDVIKRASPSATTFLTVFKAYNDVLRERGLDPQNEVVYYSKLLKLGTLKGSNWGEKWRTVKAQNGYVAVSAPIATPAKANHLKQEPSARKPHAAHLLSRLKGLRGGEENRQAPAVFDDDETIQTEETEDIPAHRARPIPRRPVSPSQATELTNSLGIDLGTSYGDTSPPPTTIDHVPSSYPHRGITKSSAVSHSIKSLSTSPPSYGRPVQGTKTTLSTPATQRTVVDTPRTVTSQTKPPTRFPRQTTPKARPAEIVEAPKPRKSVINEEDAWAKVRMAQDEKEADRFREEKLVERCWDVWKQGFEWIITTGEQIDQARDTLVLRLAIHKWRTRLAQRRDFEQQVGKLADEKVLKTALDAWTAKLKQKKQLQWRNDMRARMKSVREKRESKLRKDAWAKWRQSYQSHLSGQHYTERLVLRSFNQWKQKLVLLDDQERIADEFAASREQQVVGRSWDMWRGAVELKNTEAVVNSRVMLRIARNVLARWKLRMTENRDADAFRDQSVMKAAIRSWKAARHRIRALERAPTNILLAKTMSWLLKQAWAVWQARLQKHEKMEEKALAFSTQGRSYLSSSMLKTWRRKYSNQQTALTFAVQYNHAQLQYRMMLTWRLHLRAKLKLVRQARLVEKYFLVRRAWMLWVQRSNEQKRERKLTEFKAAKAKKILISWLQQSKRRRHLRLAEQELQDRTDTRIMKSALSLWTNRIIALKLRAMIVAQKSDHAILGSYMAKWKAVCIRHVEELSLMESYQDVKREGHLTTEGMRRMFYKWLTAARSSRNRRILLEQREEDMKRVRLTAAWDKWRGHFKAERLRPLERTFNLQNENALMFRAFVTWHSKTKSLPAVRFHAANTKAKFWKAWRDAMPRALQGKEAREVDRKNVLAKAFDKWVQAHRTKIALRAVARARYMRLPTSSSRQQPTPSRSPYLPSTSPSRHVFPREPARPTSPEGDTDLDTEPEKPAIAQPRPQLARGRAGIASLLSSRPRTRLGTDTSPTRPRFSTRSTTTREPSPTRTATTRDPSPSRATRASRPPSSAGGRSSIWMELKEIQKRARTPTVRSHSPEPP